MKKVILILYPGESSIERIGKPANYSLPRLMTHLSKTEYETYFLNYSTKKEKLGNLTFMPFSYLRLLMIIIRTLRRKVLVISQEGRFDKLAYLLKRFLGFKFVIRRGGVYHGHAYIQSEAFNIHKKSRLFYKHANLILSTADGTPVQHYFRALDIPPEKVVSYLNGFPVIPNANNYERQNYITCISRLYKIKCVDYVLKSFAAAKDRLREKYILRIVGDGPEQENLVQLAKTLNIENDILFTGASHDIEQWFYTSKLVLTGLSNNTVIESIATSTAVICVDLGEMKELYSRYPNVTIVPYKHGGYGLIPAQEEPALIQETASKIVSILNSDEWRVSVSAVDEENSWPSRIDREMSLYKSLIY